MGIKYIDIHSHLGFGDYGQDLKEVINRMEDSGVATITIGTDLESSKEAVKIANEFENVFACVGAHPADKKNFIFKEEEFSELAKNPKVVAIGECGLDYFACPQLKIESEKLKVISKEEKERQKFEFKKQIEFAVKYNKPLMLHIRDSEKILGGETLGIKKGFFSENFSSAYSDAYKILKKYEGKARGNMHFFAGSLEWAKKFVDLGFTLSFTGVITFARQYDEIIKNISLDKIHAETDSPYVAPVPFRGKRNEPSYVIEVVKKIAEIRGENFEKVRIQILENAKNTFGLKF
ncbi:MAG: TatD family hydrolase [bacterium]